MKIKNGAAELWASLNPAIDLSEILDGFLLGFSGIAGNENNRSEAFSREFDEEQFCFLDARPFDLSQQNTQIAQFEHGAEILENSFCIAMPVVATDDWPRYVAEFLEFCWPDGTPDVPKIQAKTRFQAAAPWSIRKRPALAFYAVRNTTWKAPYTSVHFNAAAGALGLHSLHTAALLQVLEQDLAFNGPDQTLAEMYAKLLPIHTRIAQYETDHAAFFEQGRQVFLSQGMEVLARFSLNQHFLIQERESASPVDLQIGQTTNQVNQWSMPTPQSMVLRAWCERITWDGFAKPRALAFLKQQKQNDEMAKAIVAQCVSLGKGTWPDLIEVLAAEPISYQCQLEIISFMADPNWPGAGEAYDVIQKNPDLFAAALQESYQWARESNDDSWMEMIGDLLGKDENKDENKDEDE
ncbi:hypothetical protein ACO0LC_23495 [Undibacterium sp. JH2W]|uniref:hypothetical protein n=1 Tax=Undibacterium sp. JH2W TaxID=3413037 RepID=UPI003BF39AE9